MGAEVGIRNNMYKLMLLNELLFSSSDSSDSELEQILLRRRKKPKVSNFIGDVIQNYTDEEFRANLRICRTTYEMIKENFEHSQYYPQRGIRNGGKPTITAEKHILSFLWFAGIKCGVREIAVLFNIGEPTFIVLCERVMDYFMSIGKDVIKFPKTFDELTNLSEAFQTVTGFPNVIGCIDGTYINMRTPAHKIKSTYVNRHHQTALTLQGICDAKKKFIDVFTGTSSKMHDSRVFSYSFVSQEIPHTCSINGVYVFHLLGHAAYPLTPYLLTPYRDYGNLTHAQRAFNKVFSSTRVIIENTFGLLKGRFRQLIRTDFHSVEKTSKFINCCCILHNFCIDQEDIWHEVYEDVEGDVPFDQPRGLLKRLGEQKRDGICAELNI